MRNWLLESTDSELRELAEALSSRWVKEIEEELSRRARERRVRRQNSSVATFNIIDSSTRLELTVTENPNHSTRESTMYWQLRVVKEDGPAMALTVQGVAVSHNGANLGIRDRVIVGLSAGAAIRTLCSGVTSVPFDRFIDKPVTAIGTLKTYEGAGGLFLLNAFPSKLQHGGDREYGPKTTEAMRKHFPQSRRS